MAHIVGLGERKITARKIRGTRSLFSQKVLMKMLTFASDSVLLFRIY